MRILCAAFVLTLLPVHQDLGDKVRQLLEKLSEDDISASDQASTDLIRLGPAALPFLREPLKTSTGDVKIKLDAIVRKIEREEKLAAVLGKPPLVTLSATDRPLAEVLAELSKQSGVAIESKDAPAGSKVSVTADRAIVWKTIDDLCRAHGNLMYTFSGTKVVIRAWKYRDLPRVIHGNCMFFIHQLELSDREGEGMSMTIQGGVAHPVQLKPFSADLHFDALEDDKGVNLLKDAGGGGIMWMDGWGGGGVAAESSLVSELSMNPDAPPDPTATALPKFAGRAVLKIALDWKKLLSIADPLGQPSSEAREKDKCLLQITSWTREGRDIKFKVQLTRQRKQGEEEDEIESVMTLGQKIILCDDKGNQLMPKTESEGSESQNGMGVTKLTERMTLVYTLAEGAKAVSLDILEPSEIEEISIPFDFKAISLK